MKVDKRDGSAEGFFAKGADISLLQQLEDAGVVFREGGRARDALSIFRDHGFNYMRLRLFHSPSGETSEVNDLPYTLKLGRRTKAEGFRFLLDFHYSDTWADPGKQYLPAAWQCLSHGGPRHARVRLAPPSIVQAECRARKRSG